MPGVSRSDPDVEGGEGINPQRKVLRQGAASFAWAEKISLSFPGAWGSFCEHCTINVWGKYWLVDLTSFDSTDSSCGPRGINLWEKYWPRPIPLNWVNSSGWGIGETNLLGSLPFAQSLDVTGFSGLPTPSHHRTQFRWQQCLRWRPKFSWNQQCKAAVISTVQQ